MDKRQEGNRNQRVVKILFWLGFLTFFAYSFWTTLDFGDLSHPRRQEAFFRILEALSRPDFSNEKATRLVAVEMWETVQMAFLATTISAVIAIIFTFFSARPASAWGRGASNLLQIMLSVVRAVHPLLTTIPVIILVGIGPTAGVLALTLFSTATFIADYSEYTQQHASLSWPILLNVHFPALAFKHYHVNIVIATVLGFMGGGGIGFSLLQNINLLNYSDAGIAIFACIITIGSFDLLGRVVWYKIQRN